MKINKLGLILFTLTTGCSKSELSTPPPRPALVMKISRHAEAIDMSVAGEIKPRYESNQGFRIDGKIIERKVEAGDLVKKGQTLVRLDPSDTNLNVGAAQSDIRSAEASRNLAAAELARYRQLSAKNFVSASALDIKAAELKTANARLEQLKVQAKITANQAQYTNLKADRDGVVTSIRAEPGQVVEAGEVIVQIADTRTLEALVAVPESHMAEVKNGALVAIKLWAHPDKIYSGRVREISPSADPVTRTFNVRVAIQNPDAAVKLGMTARVRFNKTENLQDSGFMIPSAALTELDGKPAVWVIDGDNKAQPREVVTGQFGENGILVTDGLQAGELIAIAGVHTLVKGQPVKPITETLP